MIGRLDRFKLEASLLESRCMTLAWGSGWWRSSGPTRSELEHPPRRDTVLTAGDRAYVIGPHGAVLDALVRNIASIDEPDDSDD
ncbi:MAG: hypothetical protein V9E85_00790 [Candidatus Nanopelagicales bacterium]